MTSPDDLPLGLREQLDGIQASSPRLLLLCRWCSGRIEPGEAVSLFAYRRGDTPWMKGIISCADCDDTVVGIPTMGMDEVMVRVTVVTKEGYSRKLWVDFEDAELLDREPPTSGSKATDEEAIEWMGARTPPT